MTNVDPFRKELVNLLPQLKRFAMTLTRNGTDADDLVQSTCMRAIERQDQYRPELRLFSWVCTVMRNLWVSELRKRKVRTGTGQIDAAETDVLTTEIGGANTAYGNQVMGMILALPEGMSATLLLVSIEGHSYAETADILDIPIGTVMSRMSKARQRLRGQLQEGGQ